ncbi:MAG TPA: serine/threonine-protein kinase [Polyangiales bacterium]|nr:serine/threonine-protein kinase [Polyangiales bacterium]
MTKTCRGCGREFLGSETYCPDDGFRLTASDSGDFAAAGGDPLVGVTLDGRYRILRVIGEGGMGVVYEALHVVIEKPVAVKVLRETFTSRPDVVERFRQEAKSASRIGHPNIIDVSDFGETPSGASYIVMEMLIGEDLADILARERVLSPARATRIVYQVARALDATHRKGIVHRDLKPENIYLISVDGVSDVVKVVDFGVAKMSDLDNASGRKLTRTGMLFGTPEYMSPEQAAGKPFDHRVDIYALGAIFFELLTGRVPFEGENFMEVLAKHGSDRVPTLTEVNPGTRVSYELERMVARALCKDPAERYQTMGELANDLRLAPEMPSSNPNETISLPDWALIAPGPPSLLDTNSTAPIETAKLLPPPLPRTRQSNTRRVLVWSGSAALIVLIGFATFAWRSAGTVEALNGVRQPSASLSQPAPSTAPAPTSRAAALPPVAATPRPPEVASAAPVMASAAPVASAAPATPAAQPHQPVAYRDATATEGDPNRVELRVLTEPAGARVNVFGKDTRERCKLTPCSVSIPRGQKVRVRATLGTATIRRQVSYAENAELELKFASANSPSFAEANGKSDSPSDLKVPALFR